MKWNISRIVEGKSIRDGLVALGDFNLSRIREDASPAIMDEDDAAPGDDEEMEGLDISGAACAQLQTILAGDGDDASKLAKIKRIIADHDDYTGGGEVAESRRRPFGGKRRRAV